MKNPDGEMVVVVVDEARTLLAEGKSSINNFRMLRQALSSANDQIGAEGGIFEFVSISTPKISDLTPPFSLDPPSRNFEGKKLASFPPFVLTHTMNVNWREYCKEVKQGEQKQNKMRAEVAMYKSLVTGVASKAWDALKRMGRPMWWNTFTDLAPQKSDRKVTSLAANKLLLGQSPGADTHNKNTMFGVASMLCRLGVRPYSTSTLASRAVADFTAILAYVNYEKEGYLSSYASDPVLALGTMNVWYALDAALPKYILPQLKKLVLDEALDTGGVGEIVARIVLLLAMDKCAMEDKPFSERTFTGQFVSVAAFLNELGGDRVSIYSKLCR